MGSIKAERKEDRPENQWPLCPLFMRFIILGKYISEVVHLEIEVYKY